MTSIQDGENLFLFPSSFNRLIAYNLLNILVITFDSGSSELCLHLCPLPFASRSKSCLAFNTLCRTHFLRENAEGEKNYFQLLRNQNCKAQ